MHNTLGGSDIAKLVAYSDQSRGCRQRSEFYSPTRSMRRPARLGLRRTTPLCSRPRTPSCGALDALESRGIIHCNDLEQGCLDSLLIT